MLGDYIGSLTSLSCLISFENGGFILYTLSWCSVS